MGAADVNDDGSVNVLDVVGTVNIIMNPIGGGSITPGEINYIPTEPVGQAELFWRGDTLFVDSPIPLAGLQFSFDYDLDYTLLDAVKGFESMGYAQDDEKVLMLYSLSGKKLTSGITPVLTKAEPGEIHITKAVFSNIEGRVVTANYMGYVLQDGGLFPHLSARNNVSLMAEHLGWSSKRIVSRIEELAELTHFPVDGLDRFPLQLSGGQQQRVSLMRALMLDPEVLLLDEPLGALDPMIRFELQNDLREIFSRLRKTVVMVTHDLAEAAFFGDTIVLLRGGRIVQKGTLQQMLGAPADEFVTRFIQAQRAPFEAMEQQP